MNQYEEEDLTPRSEEEAAEMERDFRAAIEKSQQSEKGWRFGLPGNEEQDARLERVFRTAAARRMVAARELREKEEKRIAELIQLPLFPYPEATRIVSNDMARSALFSATQGADRKTLKDTVLATIDGIEIIFTGEQLNQDDHDLLMQLVDFARHKPFGEEVTVPANVILSALGLEKGKSQHEQLKAGMKRLLTPLVTIRNTKKRLTYYGHIIEEAVQDEASRYWIYKLNAKMRLLYDKSSFSQIEWEGRRGLKRKDLARWLQAFYATHADPFPLSVEFLHRMSGSSAKELWKFRENLRKALDALVGINFLLAWEIDAKSDLVSVQRAGKQKDNQLSLPHISHHLNQSGKGTQ
ncbi:TrfA protein [Methylomagnum ishizawai]|uniref:TrfA protein n=1 Tax=Methylomagnum ishizawai TaxID=1760988 RepID=A0A1Y6D5P6_9GAMM|nr:plasmid replication initiator TrfA [Methylomagnum ishizawai]SMF97931.1 TrfA protein [Methylomagnum ishizawai]